MPLLSFSFRFISLLSLKVIVVPFLIHFILYVLFTKLYCVLLLGAQYYGGGAYGPPPSQMPPPQAPPPAAAPAPADMLSALSPEQQAQLRQVLSLTPEQINALPPEHRQSVIALQQQYYASQQRR